MYLPWGLDPAVVDFNALPGMSSDLVKAFIESQLERVRQNGYEIVSCLVDLGGTAKVVTLEKLNQNSFDCVLIGAGQ